MTERLRRIGRFGVRRWLPAGFVLLIGILTALGGSAGIGWPTSAQPSAAELHALLAAPGRDRILVAFDPDVGTYAEVRPAVRAAFAQLVRAGATLSVVSFTPEGRALAVAELDRLRRGGVEEARLLDLGFHAGAEAGLVAATSRLVPAGASGALAEAVRDAGGGIAAFDAVLVVGGGDIGPRSWVEQVGTRLPETTIAAIVPTSLLPQAVPYRSSGQLDALVAGVREASAYVAAVRDDPAASAAREAERVDDAAPSALPIIAGALLLLVGLADAIAGRWRRDAA
ncbi:MAG TPA: hypothetical protein VFM19_03170 [Candidatus Limnocylindria bacterium]|nr:hypothetical protein [Candidatus Limnocylindria bacterium]